MTKDWTKIYQKYKGMWVALAEDEVTVVGFGKKISEAIEKAKNNGNNDPIMMRVPDESLVYVGGFYEV
jgi:D-serine dehydratase